MMKLKFLSRLLAAVSIIAVSTLTLVLSCAGPVGPPDFDSWPGDGPMQPGRQFNPNISYGSFTDNRDGQVYRTVQIGTQTWMAENLNFNASGSVCYNNNSSNCNTYGRLYDWATVMGLSSTCNSSSCASQVQSRHRGVCPAGWHVPSDAEWTTLTNYVGSNAGTKLKSQSGWYSGGNGTDEFGFSALPGGSRWSGNFVNAGSFGYWWSATEHGAANARYRDMHWGIASVFTFWVGKTFGFSVRCLED